MPSNLKKSKKLLSISNDMESVVADAMPYIDLLGDNCPKSCEEYATDAAILEKEIKTDGVNNIAIVAKYGAGKSSLIKTYLDKYRQNKKNTYEQITLSAFNGSQQDTLAIERSILQQLLYTQKSTKLPKSKIKRTNKSGIIPAIILSLGVIIFLVCLLMFSMFTAQVLPLPLGNHTISYVFLGVSFGALLGLLYYCIRYDKFRKINYKDLITIDLEQSVDVNDKSVTDLINRFLDEILYYFECTKVDLVILEDLDRFNNCVEVFSKLRELNTIINNCIKRKVTFIYAVRDDIFNSSENRSKFFDYILSITSVVNPITTANQLEKLITKVYERDNSMGLSKKFIKGVSQYILNMRILQNSVNDYILMFNRIFDKKDINIEKMTNEKLFSLCLYKNLYPQDYSLLEHNEGLIPLIIDIPRLIENEKNNIENEIIQLENYKTDINKEVLDSIEDLKTLLKAQYINHIDYSNYCYSAYEGVNIESIQTFEGLDFRKIKQPANKSYFINFPDPDNVVSPNGKTYIERERLIRNKNSVKLSEIETDIKSKKSRIKSLYRTTLVDIVDNRNNIDCVDFDKIEQEYIEKYCKNSEKDIDSEKLGKEVNDQILYIKYLIINDFIDERYMEYVIPNNDNNLSLSDAQYIRKVQRNEVDELYEINDYEKVVKQLDEDDFEYKAIFNETHFKQFETLEQIDLKDHTHKANNLFKLLLSRENGSKTTKLNIVAIIDDDRYVYLIKKIINQDENIILDVFAGDNVDSVEKANVLINIIDYANDYTKISNKELLQKFVYEYEKYDEIFSKVKAQNKLADFIRDVDLKFSQLKEVDYPYQNQIINENRYDINYDNLKIALRIPESQELEYKTDNYTYIDNSTNDDVKRYINDNFDCYINNVLLDDRVTDIVAYDFCLGNDKVDLLTKQRFIEKFNFTVIDLLDYNNDIWKYLFDNHRVLVSWYNLQLMTGIMEKEYIKNWFFAQPSIKITCSQCQTVSTEQFVSIVNMILSFDYSGEDIESFQNLFINSPFECQLQDFSINSTTSDEILACFIERCDRLLYDDSVLNILLHKPKSLQKYIIRFDKDIDSDFDKFFDNKLYIENKELLGKEVKLFTNDYQSLSKTILSIDNTNLAVPEKYFNYYSDYLLIQNYEKLYYDFIMNHSVKVPFNILWQFTDCNEISGKDKKELLSKCDLNNINSDNEKFGNIKYLIKYLAQCNEKYASLFSCNEVLFNQDEISTIWFKYLEHQKLITRKKEKGKDVHKVKLVDEHKTIVST